MNTSFMKPYLGREASIQLCTTCPGKAKPFSCLSVLNGYGHVAQGVGG